ncbi:unnamed protein product [Effrenium voratum]|uniref:Malic enzyme NAD-binding domain-containing protein n=1 Tax=Effrenium voratum TaxID=2562239 RepID=A0AA36IVQ5_9DINO|nr:unnamed protein product [Effrenium voratum]
MSFGAVCCEATTIPDELFMTAAEAVAHSLDEDDRKSESVLPCTARIREVGLKVATAVVLAAQEAGLARKKLGSTEEEVAKALRALRWEPGAKEVKPKADVAPLRLRGSRI